LDTFTLSIHDVFWLGLGPVGRRQGEVIRARGDATDAKERLSQQRVNGRISTGEDLLTLAKPGERAFILERTYELSGSFPSTHGLTQGCS
jgi:hypothetical protein